MKERYLEYISTAAFSPYIPPGEVINLNELGNIFCIEWRLLEADAKSRGYDVLKIPRVIRHRVRKLIQMLFWVPGSHPDSDIAHLFKKDKEYGGSWVRRGGVGAFFVTARKMDRIVEQLEHWGGLERAIQHDLRTEGILDDIGDLRRYLILWEAWWLAL